MFVTEATNVDLSNFGTPHITNSVIVFFFFHSATTGCFHTYCTEQHINDLKEYHRLKQT